MDVPIPRIQEEVFEVAKVNSQERESERSAFFFLKWNC